MGVNHSCLRVMLLCCWLSCLVVGVIRVVVIEPILFAIVVVIMISYLFVHVFVVVAVRYDSFGLLSSVPFASLSMMTMMMMIWRRTIVCVVLE